MTRSDEAMVDASIDKPAHVKASLLAHGVVLTPAFLQNYGRPYLEKRRAYGNSDPLEFRDSLLPQEMFLLPSRTICAVNLRRTSPWMLDWHDGEFFVHHADGRRMNVTFPLRPRFYDSQTNAGQRVSKFITLYGGSSLGAFIYGNCALVDMNKACQYCSIQPNHDRGTDFENIIRPEQLEDALVQALDDTETPVTQVMLNGGNFRDVDRSFRYYATVARAARRAIDRSHRNVELHLIVFPPRDYGLYEILADLDICVAMNSEVFDEALFNRFCPGKAVIAGHKQMFDSMAMGARILGSGHVFSIIVGGLEPLHSLEGGLAMLADNGVVPIINVFHADPETPLADHPMPSAEMIVSMGQSLQRTYEGHSWMRPFYEDCGRNAIDTEAHRQMF